MKNLFSYFSFLLFLIIFINLNILIKSNEILDEELLQDFKPSNKIGIIKRGKKGKSSPSSSSSSSHLDINAGGNDDITQGDYIKRPKGKMKRTYNNIHNNNNNKLKYNNQNKLNSQNQIIPVLGEIAINGTKPMIGSHTGRDGIFALACNYPLELFKFFVGSVRRFGYTDDIVLAVNPKNLMPPTTYQYLVETNVVGYAFEVDCRKKDDCQLKNSFYGYKFSFSFFFSLFLTKLIISFQ